MYFNFLAAAKYIAHKNLVQASSGNLSYLMVDRKHLQITSSGSWMERLEDYDVIDCDFPSGNVSQFNKQFDMKPSSELPMHIAIYERRPDVNVVLHCQSPHATTLATMIAYHDMQIDELNVIPEIPHYIGAVRYVKYFHPGSKELVLAVGQQCTYGDAIILGNHGQVIMGKDFDDVIQKALFLDLASQVLINPPRGSDINIICEEDCRKLKRYKELRP